MKVILCAALLAISSTWTLAADIPATIKEEAQNCAKAILASDYDGVVKYTHPRVVKLMGGREAMVTAMQRGAAQMKAGGAAFEDARIGTPEEPRKIATWLTSIVPEHIVMKVPGGRLDQDSVLLGISEDDGKTWTFIDLGPLTPAQFAQVFPELDGKIALPDKKKPVFEKDN